MGIDLSGPSNSEETVLVVFGVQGESLQTVQTLRRAYASLLMELIAALLFQS